MGEHLQRRHAVDQRQGIADVDLGRPQQRLAERAIEVVEDVVDPEAARI